MKQYYINSNIKKVANWIVDVSSELTNDELAHEIAIEFVEQAKQRLRESGKFLETDITKYVNSIRERKLPNGKGYRIYAGYGGDQDLKDDMYYFEYGTGITGAWSPHPDATSIGWKYDKNNHGYKGWVFNLDENKDQVIAQDDTILLSKDGEQRAVRTKGIIAMRYFYDTIQHFDDIVATVLRRLNK